MEPDYIYVWVRKDINLAQQLVQVGHVCYDAGKEFGFTKYGSPHMVLLQVDDLEALIDVSSHLKIEGVQYSMFYEPDNSMGFSAICTEPVRGPVRDTLSTYPLWIHLS